MDILPTHYLGYNKIYWAAIYSVLKIFSSKGKCVSIGL